MFFLNKMCVTTCIFQMWDNKANHKSYCGQFGQAADQCWAVISWKKNETWIYSLSKVDFCVCSKDNDNIKHFIYTVYFSA